MKRLKLNAFQAKNLKEETTHQIDQLLGQVLGDCHDADAHSTDSSLRKRPGRKKFSNITLKK